MEQPTVRKRFKKKPHPTPAQKRALDDVLWRCRTLSNTALEQRITAWQRRYVSVSRFQQEAALKEIRAEFHEYAAMHSHVLQDVLARLDKTYQAFFRRVQRGEKAGFPRCKGRNRFHSFTYKEFGNGATLDNGFLVLSKIGRIAAHWSRPIDGTPRPSPSPNRRMVGTSRSPAPMCQSTRFPPLDKRRGLILGSSSLLPSPMGHASSRRDVIAEQKPIWPSANDASLVARRGAIAGARR
jgi:hypothetical protein